MRKILGVAFVLGVVAAGSPAALAGTAGKPITWQFDFGYSMPQGDPAKLMQDGWTIGFGQVIRAWPKSPVAVRWDFAYDWWDVNTGELPDHQVRIDDGDVDQWSLRVGLQFESHGDKAKFIGGAGIGGYRVHADLTQEVLVPGWICDPYWWYYCYPGLVQGDVILSDKTLTKFGWYATAGVSFPLTNSDIYIEAQYHWVNVEQYFETLPIVIGWRF